MIHLLPCTVDHGRFVRSCQQAGEPPKIRDGQHKALGQTFRTELPAPSTLEDLLKAIKKQTTKPDFPGIPIYVSPLGLYEADARMASEIEVGWKGHPIQRVLSETLRPLKLDYVVHDGFLMIDSRHDVLRLRLDAVEAKLDRILDAVETPKSKD